MTFWEILNNMSDFLFVFFWTFFVLCIGAILIYSIITKRSVEEIMQAGATADIEEDECIKRLDKLQETVDCLASKHLDAEAMRELQGDSEVSEEPKQPYISTMREPFDEKTFSTWRGVFNSFLDGMIDDLCKHLNKTYDKIPDWDKVRSLRQASKIQKLEKDIEYDRFCINLLGFIQAQGFDAFKVYLRRQCFMPANEEAVERKNNIMNEVPEFSELTEISERADDET